MALGLGVTGFCFGCMWLGCFISGLLDWWVGGLGCCSCGLLATLCLLYFAGEVLVLVSLLCGGFVFFGSWFWV